MFNRVVLSIALVVISSCATTSHSSSHAVRLDATTDASAQASFTKTFHQLSPNQQQALSIAVLKLNMVGVKGVAEVLGSARLQKPSIVFVKDRVAGMTADEIIDLGNRTSDVKVEVQEN